MNKGFSFVDIGSTKESVSVERDSMLNDLYIDKANIEAACGGSMISVGIGGTVQETVPEAINSLRMNVERLNFNSYTMDG